MNDVLGVMHNHHQVFSLFILFFHNFTQFSKIIEKRSPIKISIMQVIKVGFHYQMWKRCIHCDFWAEDPLLWSNSFAEIPESLRLMQCLGFQHNVGHAFLTDFTSFQVLFILVVTPRGKRNLRKTLHVNSKKSKKKGLLESNSRQTDPRLLMFLIMKVNEAKWYNFHLESNCGFAICEVAPSASLVICKTALMTWTYLREVVCRLR